MPESAKWFAVRIRSRCEKSAANYLAAKGLEICSAVVPQRRAWSDRIKVVDIPLFPGYIFARFSPRRRVEVLKVPGAVSIVGFGSRDCPIEDSEIDALQKLLRSGSDLQRVPFLSVGAKVRVRIGAFRDATGVLQQFKTGHRLVVSVTLLQRSVAVEIDEAMVEPLPLSSLRGAA